MSRPKITAKVSQSDQQYIRNMLKNAEKKTVKFANNAIKRTAIVFFRAAAKRTGPGRSSTIKGMNKKAKIRPVVALSINKQHQMGVYWYRNNTTGKIFSHNKQLGRIRRYGSHNEGNLPISDGDDETQQYTPIKRAVKIWSKKRRRFVYVGTDLTKGLHAGNNQTRIPGAGAGKGGWIRGLRNLGVNKKSSIGRLNTKIARTRFVRGRNPLITHINNIDYVSKIAPGVVSASYAATANHIKKAEQRKFERLAKREFKARV